MTTTGRKVIAIYGDALLDDVRGIEAEALAARNAEIAEAVRWVNPMMTHPAAIKAVAEFRAMLLAIVETP